MPRAPFPCVLCQTAPRMGSGGRCGDGRRLSRGRSTEARPRRSRQRRGIVALRAALGLLATGCLLAGCAAGGSGTANKAAHHKKSSGVPTTPPSTAVAGGPDCPLTGTPAPHGVVPKRSALAVKVDNYPAARPQTGLTAADVVFEEPVEGGITRYVAIFQCRGAPEVGDVRSARNIDIGILGQLGHPLLVHVGGIQPVIADILSSPIQDFELGNHTTIIQHVPGRFAPYDTYTSTGAVWHLRSTADQPPQPLFAYSKVVPAGTPVKSVSIPFSRYSPVVWRYDAATRKFLRFYDSSPDKLSNGVQNSASNVIVQIVNVTYGPWLENSTGGLEVQANLYTHASGEAIVFRDGVEIAGRWSRTNLAEPTSFATASGQRITMQPGNTWVELVPAPVSVTATP